MKTYISFLRGINMTGHNSVRMTDLLDLFKVLGFSDAKTYIQSGNVIFNSMEVMAAADISAIIEIAILERFSYSIPVLLRTVGEMRELISANPFLNENKFDPSKMAVIFLYEEASKAQIQNVLNIHYPPDKFKIIGSEIFIYCPNGFGKTKLYTNFFEKKMGVTGTARNWKTITTIFKIAEGK